MSLYVIKNKTTGNEISHPMRTHEIMRWYSKLDSEKYEITKAFQSKKPEVVVEVKIELDEITSEESRAIAALQEVSLVPASSHKRFVRDIAGAVKLSVKQKLHLWYLVHRYRKQISDKELVDIAEKKKEY